MEKCVLGTYADSDGPDQSAHLRTLIETFALSIRFSAGFFTAETTLVTSCLFSEKGSILKVT